MKILAHFTDYMHRPERKKLNTFGALGYYRIHSPMKQLKKHQVEVVGVGIDSYGDTFEENWKNIFKQNDAFWMLHAFGEKVLAAQAYCAEKYQKLLIYDLDDDYLDVPETNPVYDKFKKANSIEDVGTVRTRGALSASFSFADVLTVSTEPLKARMEKHFKEVFHMKKEIVVIPNMNTIGDWNYAPVPKYKDRVVIGYSGSNSHQSDLIKALPAIRNLMQKYEYLHLEIIGAIEKSKLDFYFKDWPMKLLDRVGLIPATATFWEYPEWLSKQKWDIGIAPLEDSEFNRCKSHIKWMEYSMYKIPTVASRVYPYFMPILGRKTITDRQTGMLCRDNEWEARLEELILDKELREKIGTQAYEHVKKNWQYKDFNMDKLVDKFKKTKTRNIDSFSVTSPK